MQLTIQTTIDITNTGILRNERSVGSTLSKEEWDFKRNQERNWSVVVQLLGLRFQPVDITKPTQKDNIWEFTCRFEHEFPLELIIEDFNDIPMIINLNEKITFDKACFISRGENANIWVKA